jgi:hypothetical protein
MPRLLLVSVFAPYGVKNEYDIGRGMQMELLGLATYVRERFGPDCPSGIVVSIATAGEVDHAIVRVYETLGRLRDAPEDLGK